MTVYIHRGGVEAGSGPAVIFIHGAGGDHTVWRFQTRWLAHGGYRVAAPDLPGHGRSSEPIRHSIEEWADWVVAFAAKWAPATIIGHSMGGLIALAATASCPERFSGLVLVGTTPRMAVHPKLLASARDDSPLAAELLAAWSYPAGFGGGHLEAGTWQPGGTERLIRRSPSHALATDLAACAAYDGEGAARAVEVPALVVVGRADRMTPPRQQRELAGLIAGARLVEMEGVGHEPMLQRPRLFNRALADFLRDVYGGGAG